MKKNEISEKEASIIKTALTLFVKQGFHGTPTSQIAEQAGVSNGTLFHYFKTKEDLINRLYLFLKMQVFEAINLQIDNTGTVQQKLKVVWKNMVHWALKNKDGFYFIQQFTFSPYLTKLTKDKIEDQKKIYDELIQSGKQQGVIKGVSNELLYSMTISILNGYIQFLSSDSEIKSNEKTQEEAFNILWDAIKK